MSVKDFLLFIISVVLLSSCATSHHGTFVTSSYNGQEGHNSNVLGDVTGQSKQTWILYMFPSGKAPSTNTAINDAKSQITGTDFLTDIAIDDRIYWGIGYREQIIEVKARAHSFQN
ncbi:hypothetical protein [Desulforhopalus sp. 52FAK]